MRQDDLIAAPRAAAIRHAATPRDFELARALFLEYAQWLKVDLCFQGFDAELATLPGAYAPPRGRLLLAGAPDEAFSCIALRPLESDGACGCSGEGASTRTDALTGEVKRLYVQPAHRGEGWARRLAQVLLDEARAIGYRELKLDTLSWMSPARALYASLGFRECAPYYRNPLPGVVYMSLAL
ncbi:MAG TPA: GNAT family N-acetyltransferase [Casimicrobiaceae bacterium]|nr:GNAT family N-acetyltransferase [Casimicrobiaceae bacterium]